jgi:hypothetical protein
LIYIFKILKGVIMGSCISVGRGNMSQSNTVNKGKRRQDNSSQIELRNLQQDVRNQLLTHYESAKVDNIIQTANRYKFPLEGLIPLTQRAEVGNIVYLIDDSGSMFPSGSMDELKQRIPTFIALDHAYGNNITLKTLNQRQIVSNSSSPKKLESLVGFVANISNHRYATPLNRKFNDAIQSLNGQDGIIQIFTDGEPTDNMYDQTTINYFWGTLNTQAQAKQASLIAERDVLTQQLKQIGLDQQRINNNPKIRNLEREIQNVQNTQATMLTCSLEVKGFIYSLHNRPDNVAVIISACTDNENSVAYLDIADNLSSFLPSNHKDDRRIGVHDDFQSELAQVTAQQEGNNLPQQFLRDITRISEFMSGIDKNYDGLDEHKVPPHVIEALLYATNKEEVIETQKKLIKDEYNNPNKVYGKDWDAPPAYHAASSPQPVASSSKA